MPRRRGVSDLDREVRSVLPVEGDQQPVVQRHVRERSHELLLPTAHQPAPTTGEVSAALVLDSGEHSPNVRLAYDVRHAGHADLVRELIDGAIGADRRWSNLPRGDEAWWASYRDRVEAAARHAGGVT